VLDAGQFLRASVLAPSLREAVLIEDKGGVRSIGPDPVLLGRTGG
jgi:hypothetical protein